MPETGGRSASAYTSERWGTIRATFEEVFDLPADQRHARLLQLTDEDPDLRREVAELLSAAASVGDRFEHLPPDAFDDAEPAGLAEDARVGPYRIVREVGRGGMGAVYEARRDDHGFDKRVALKMVARGRDTEAILRRFRHERRILARLEHRNIAALVDGGVAPDGRPYFAMEYVEGERIDAYAERQALGIPARLQLVRQVCGAVQYAHRSLVVHRDLKPSNILVAADGTVKLLDFGIAKLLESGEDSDDPLTQTGMSPMTTWYASPEQRAGAPITTASDIYSLGVVLYLLLTGRHPFAADDAAVPDSRAVAADADPVLPSRVVVRDTATRSRASDLKGDLDNIVMKALRREPDRRYASAEALGDDIQRYLSSQPVLATPDSVGYRVARFVRRNRLGVTASAVAIAAVLVGSVVSVWQARAARLAQHHAEAEREKSAQLTEFLRSVFLSASPVRLGQKVTVADAIDAAIPRIDSAFDRPEQAGVRRALKSTLGTTLYEMGLPEKAKPLTQAALTAQLEADSGRVTLDGTNEIFNLATIEYELGNLAPAESLFRVSLARFEKLPEVSPADRARAWGQLALAVSGQGRMAEALEYEQRTVTLLRASLPPSDRGYRTALANYGADLTEAGRLGEGERYLREAAQLSARYDGPERDELSLVLQPLAVNLLYSGQLAPAESVARESYRIAVANRGPENTTSLRALRALLGVLVARGSCAEASDRARGVIRLRGHGLSETDLSLGSAYQALGQCLTHEGHAAQAMDALQEAVKLRAAVLPATHWAVGYARLLLGEATVQAGRRAAGEALLRDGFRTMTTALGADHPRCREAKAHLERLGIAP